MTNSKPFESTNSREESKGDPSVSVPVKCTRTHEPAGGVPKEELPAARSFLWTPPSPLMSKPPKATASNGGGGGAFRRFWMRAEAVVMLAA